MTKRFKQDEVWFKPYDEAEARLEMKTEIALAKMQRAKEKLEADKKKEEKKEGR